MARSGLLAQIVDVAEEPERDASERKHDRCEEEPVHEPTDRPVGVAPLVLRELLHASQTSSPSSGWRGATSGAAIETIQPWMPKVPERSRVV
jgi:hypothetical protein